MSQELKDFRGKLTPRAWCVATAISQAEVRDIAEVVRVVMDEWAAKQIEVHKITERLLRVEGLAESARGKLGKTGGDE